jgi:hypothetical protein
MLVFDELGSKMCLVDLGTDANNWCHTTGSPWARGIQLVGNNQVLGARNDGYQIFDLTTGALVKTVTGYPTTQGVYRLATGETMLTQSGTTLTFLGADDLPSHRIAYPGYGYVRLARPTRNGTFLVPSDTKVLEGDATGKVLWTATGTGWGHAFEALLMKDGNTIVANGFGASLDVVDKTTHQVTVRFGGRTTPTPQTDSPTFFGEFQILPNGNLLTSNYVGGHGGGPAYGTQAFEFDPAGNVVWTWKADPKVFSSAIQGVMVIDGLDPRYLHVQETSDDSTWQPVSPR